MKRHNELKLKELLEMFTHDSKYEKQLNEIKIKEIWDEHMGKTIARHTLSLNLLNHVLYVRIDSSVLRNELHMNKQTILNKLNAIIGTDLIKEIALQ